jgi:hypothetical protein
VSRIYFHTQHEGEAEVLGSERAHMGILTRDLAIAIVPSSADRQVLAALRPDVRRKYECVTDPNTPPLDERHGPYFDYDLLPMLFYGFDGPGNFQLNGTPLETFSLILNTALALGSDALCLMTRLHAQCELHAYVEGPHRSWFADVIGQGLDAGLYRSDMGWDEVQNLLRQDNEHPVVTSYSVTNGFPNETVAGWESPLDEDGEPDYDAWYEHPRDQQWEQALAGLRAIEDIDALSPATLRRRFGHGKSVFDLFYGGSL